MTSGFGPVLEKEMPFTGEEEKIYLSGINKTQAKQLKSFVRFPSIYKTVANGITTYKDNKGNILSETQVNNIREQVKEHIMSNGSVSADLYCTKEYFDTGNEHTGVAYYCNQVNNNHQVTIVGWDDNYSKDNFKASCRPSKDGAWIVQNSWGTQYNKGGYMYVSYEDVNIENDMTGIISVEDVDHENIYQYDILSANYNMTMTTGEDKNIYIANVYTRTEAKTEEITEIGITSSDNVTADIYINTNGDLNIDNAKKVATDVTLTPGYKTIKCNQTVLLENEKFAIIVKYNTNSVTVPVEKQDNLWHATATANEGESYYTDTKEQFQDLTRIYSGGNFCIKVFTIKNTDGIDIQGPNISFEINGNTTYQRIQSTKVSVTDNKGVDESSLKYIWTQNTEVPSDSQFKNSFINNSVISKNNGTGTNWHLWIMAKDINGNVSYKRSEAFYFDNTIPVAPIITANIQSGEVSIGNVSINVTGSDSLSGITKYQYSLDNGKTWIDLIDGKLTLNKTGIYKVKARAVNSVGISGTTTIEYVITINKITSGKYLMPDEISIIRKILPKTTIDDFKKEFSIEANKVHIYKDEKTQTEIKEGYIKSNMIIKFDGVEEKYTALVVGDINGDGLANQVELQNIIKHIIGLKKYQLTGERLLCADINTDNVVNQKDLKLLINYILYNRWQI